MRWEMLPDGTYTKPATRCEESVLSACFLCGEVKRKETRDLMDLSAHLGTQDALIRYHEGKV